MAATSALRHTCQLEQIRFGQPGRLFFYTDILTPYSSAPTLPDGL
jgi:hypothetical protein